MKTKSKKPSGMRIEFWVTYMNVWNYRLVAQNGENLYHTRQQFDTKAMMIKSVDAVATCYGGSRKNIPMHQVKPPKITK